MSNFIKIIHPPNPLVEGRKAAGLFLNEDINSPFKSDKARVENIGGQKQSSDSWNKFSI